MPSIFSLPSQTALNDTDVLVYGKDPAGTPTASKITAAAARTYMQTGTAAVFNVKDYGAKGDGKTVTDGAITSGSATFTSATANFTAADVGKSIFIAGAGTSGGIMSPGISAFVNSTTVTLSATASTTVTGATTYWATYDDTALINAFTAGGSAKGEVFFPAGSYFSYSNLTVPDGVSVVFASRATEIKFWNAGIVPSGNNIISGGTLADVTPVSMSGGFHTNLITPAASAKHVLIDSVTFGSAMRGVYLNQSGISDVTVERCYFNGPQYGVASDTGANDMSDLKVLDNTFNSVTADAVELNHPHASISGGVRPTGVVVRGNQINSAGGFGIAIAGVQGPLVDGNRISGGGSAQIHIEDDCYDVTIANNKCYNGAGYGMELLGSLGLAVTGNTIRGSGTYGIYISSGTGIEDRVRMISITANVFHSTGSHGILAFGEEIYASIVGNMFEACGGKGIEADGNGGRRMPLQITGNTFRNCVGVAIDAAGGPGLEIDNNFIEGTGGYLTRQATTGTNPLFTGKFTRIWYALAVGAGDVTASQPVIPMENIRKGTLRVTAQVQQNFSMASAVWLVDNTKATPVFTLVDSQGDAIVSPIPTPTVASSVLNVSAFYSGGNGNKNIHLEATFTPEMAGTVGSFFNARDYGAVGDGTTANQTAFLNAMTAANNAGGGVVYVPAGNYLLTATLTPPAACKNVRFMGSGPGTRLFTNTIDTLISLSATGGDMEQVVISDMLLDGNFVTTNAIIQFGGETARNCTIERCHVRDSANTMIYAWWSRNLTIQDNYIYRSDGKPNATGILLVEGGSYGRVRRNRVEWCNRAITYATDNQAHHNLEYTDNLVHGHWWQTPTDVTNSGGTVTYTSTTLVDSSAPFTFATGYTANSRNVRVLVSARAGTANYTGTLVTDGAANFTTAGIQPGYIIRTATKWAVVHRVIGTTTLWVEQWYPRTTSWGTPTTEPANSTAYTIYEPILGNIASATTTTLTIRTGWSRFHNGGAAVTPSAGVLYEVMVPHNDGSGLFFSSGVYGGTMARNTIEATYREGLFNFGPGNRIEGNFVRHVQDFGCTTQGAGAAGSVISGNHFVNCGVAGIDVIAPDCTVTGNLIEGCPSYLTGAGSALYVGVNGDRNVVQGNRMVNTAVNTAWVSSTVATVGISIAGANNQVSGNMMTGYSANFDMTSAGAGNDTTGNYGDRATFSNAARTVTAAEHYVAQVGTMSASRAVTLPAASAVAAGTAILIADESGTVTGTNTLVVTRAGSDTINGATTTTINAAYGTKRVMSDGTSKWTVV